MRRDDTVVAPMPTGSSQRSFDDDHEDTRLRDPIPMAPRPSAPPPPPRVLPFIPHVKTSPALTPAGILERQAAQREPAPAPVEEIDSSLLTSPVTHGKVLVVFGCRGGAGATTLAVNLASAMTRAGKNVCVLDLDLQLGDVFVALDLEPTTSVAALAREAGTIDAPALRRRLARHDSGIYALSQVGALDDVDPQLPDRMPALLACLTDHFDYVIVDGIRDFSDHALAALDMADQIAMVLTQDVPAVRRASRVLELFRKLGYSDKKLKVVMNRYVKKSTVSEDEVARALGLPVFGVVRNDYKRMRAALDEGALLHDIARGSGVSRDVSEIADGLIGPTAAAKKRGGLLSRLLKKEKK